MRRASRQAWLPAGLAALAYALALLQRPGVAVSDTKIDLHVDAAGFLRDVAAAWTPTGDLGHVASGQYAGYLWPMGPFFAAGEALGLAPWLIHRLWLGTVLALAAVGAVALADALLGGRRAPAAARLAAGAVYLLNPYVVTFANRTSVTLLAYAALPWLLLCAHRGVRSPARWWWPAAGALVLTSAGGGVNAAVVAWLLLAPLLLLAYEWRVAGVPGRDVWAFAWRAGIAAAVASAWWAVPAMVQALYGSDFLQFIEQPGTIWSTTSVAEALRLMGYWVSYIGVGYTGDLHPFSTAAGPLLFDRAVVLATLLVPAAALATFAWTRRERHVPYALALVLVGVAAVAASFPAGTPGRRALHFLYNHVEALQFLRTTHKAAPLIAVGLALLAGAGAAALARRVTRPVPRATLAAACAAMVALSAWPLVRGQAVDAQLDWDAIPRAWARAADAVDRELAPGRRAVVLPGELFAFYAWGGTYDPILPALAERPVAQRTSVPYADLRAVDLLWTADALVQQQRLLPGQLPALLRLMGAGGVISASDSDRARSGALAPGPAWAQLTGPGALGEPEAAFGPSRLAGPAAGALGASRRVPQVALWTTDAPPMVRLAPRAGVTLLDGSAEGVAALAALAGLPAGRALIYGADLAPAALRDAVRAGAAVVITDGNRRRVYVGSRLRQNVGRVLTAQDGFSEDAAVLDPVGSGPDAQTVAVFDGIRDVRAPYSPTAAQFPERGPWAALDGDAATSWLADPGLDRERHRIEILLGARRDVATIALLPHADARGHVTEVEVGGRRHRVRRGWNRLRVDLGDVRRLTVAITDTTRGPRGRGHGGIAELRIPGVRPARLLRPPVVLERALAGEDFRRSPLAYVFTRETGDDPFRRSPAAGAPQDRLTRDRGDAERQLARRVTPPAARTWRADGWVTVDPRAPDDRLDALAGTVSATRFASTGRFEGHAGHRASRAFDGDRRSAWIGMWIEGRRTALTWRSRAPRTLRTLRLTPPAERVRRPRAVRLVVDGRPGPRLAVRADGRVALPEPVRGRAVTLEVLDAAFPAGTDGATRQRRAVGIAEIAGAGVGAPHAAPADTRTSACGAMRVDASDTASLLMRVRFRVADLDAGRPLRARPCGDPAALPARTVDLRTRSALLLPATVRLLSAAPIPAGVGSAGEVRDTGTARRTAWEDVRVRVDRPAWLVLGQSYSRGWRATCDGRDLGDPVPIDAHGNGWRVEPGCSAVAFRWAPQRAVIAGYGVSAAGCLALLAILLVRRRPAVRDAGAPARRPEAVAVPLPRRRAAAWALAASAVIGVAFALRAGAVAFPVLYVILRRGIGARDLTLAAAALLGVVVPAIQLLALPEDKGGYRFDYAPSLLGAHWVALAGLVLLAAALCRSLAFTTSRGGAARSGTRRLRPSARRSTSRHEIHPASTESAVPPRR